MVSFIQYILNQTYFFAGKTVGDKIQTKYSTSLAKYLLEVEKCGIYCGAMFSDSLFYF